MGCKAVSETYLKILNIIVLICSLILIGYGSYLTASLSDYKDAIDSFVILAPLILGVFLFILSVIGIVAVAKQNKCLLFLYIIATVLIAIIVLSAGIVLLSFSDVLDDVKNGDKVSSKVQAKVQDVALAVYQVCCVDEFSTTPPVTCFEYEYAPSVCISDEEFFTKTVENLNDAVCDALTDLKIVGEPAPGRCGNGSSEPFVSELVEYLKENIKSVGITTLVIAVILLMDIIAACVLLWSKKDLKQKYLGYKMEEKGGPELATGERGDIVYAQKV